MPNILEIPLEGDDVLTVNLDADLPEDPVEICTLLENESCAAQYWAAFGAAYARIGQTDSALEVLNRGLELPEKTEDWKQAFYAALSWLYISQLNQAAPGAKQDLFDAAQRNLQRALSIDSADRTALLAKAALLLHKGQYDDALQPTQQLLAKSDNLFARFARARILCHRKNWLGALSLYQSILKDYPGPDLRPDPRIGIGLCFWKLEDHSHAFAAWTRAHELQPNNVAVLTMLGLYHLNEALRGLDFEAQYRSALEFMQQAYNAQGDSSLASLVIASYLFAKQNMNHVLKLAERAIELASLPRLISDAYFWRARVHHFRNQLSPALEAYKQSLEANPDNLGALLGCGVVELLEEAQDAVHTFEKAVKRHPKNAQAMLLYAVSLYKRAINSDDQKRIKKAISMLEKYQELAQAAGEPVEPEALLALSVLHQQTGQMPPTAALECLQRAIALVTDEGKNLDALAPELCNNRGVLAYYCGNYDEARAAFQRALESQSHKPTVDFNLARLEDAAGNPDKARAGYKRVLDEFPQYVDAQIRDAFLDVVLAGSADAVDAVLEAHPKDLEVRALQGWQLRRKIRAGQKLEGEEQSHYKKTLMEVNKHDAYSLIAMGNMYLANARELRVTKEGDAQKRDKAYYKASEFFDKALQIDKFNAYAAQGIAIVLAETKRPRQALQILDKACETIQDASVYMNSGHCLMDLKDYGRAIEMYSVALERSGGKDLTLFTLLGRAWSASGLSKKDIKAMQEGLKYAELALECSPKTLPLQSNVALLKYQTADAVRKLAPEGRSVALIEQAQIQAQEAIESLREIAKAKSPPFKAADLEARAKQVEKVKEHLVTELASQRDYEQTAQFKLNEARKVREEEQRKLAADLKRKREEELERERALEAERLELQKQASQWQSEREIVEPEPKKARRKSRQDAEFVDDNKQPSESDSESEPEPEPAAEPSVNKKQVVSDDEDDDKMDVDDLF